MAYVKLFESWIKNKIYEAADVKPTDVAKVFPVDTEQWGSMDFVAGKKTTDMEGLTTYLDQKLKALTKNMPVKFKVTFNKKGGGNGTVEIVPSNNPKIKFYTGGSLFKPKNASAAELNPYGKTLFNYGGWVEEDGKEIIGDRDQALDFRQGGDWRLGEFISAAIQKKDITEISQTPKDFALNVALTYDSSKEGKPMTMDNIVSKVSSGVGDNLAPKEGGK
jgi:hypothetical protein